MFLILCFFFFFSSRRRHTRSYGDWSSDVCSSDLLEEYLMDVVSAPSLPRRASRAGGEACPVRRPAGSRELSRSEERRVGKECRIRGGQDEGMDNGALNTAMAIDDDTPTTIEDNLV